MASGVDSMTLKAVWCNNFYGMLPSKVCSLFEEFSFIIIIPIDPISIDPIVLRHHKMSLLQWSCTMYLGYMFSPASTHRSTQRTF